MESAEHAAEEGDADALALILHTDYRDAYGRDRRAMVFMLRSLLRRYPRMEVAARDMEIEMLSPQLAKVELTVVAVARNRDRPLRAAFDADQRRLRLAMRADGDLWYVTRAEWRLAGLD